MVRLKWGAGGRKLTFGLRGAAPQTNSIIHVRDLLEHSLQREQKPVLLSALR